MWVQGTEPASSARAASAPSHRATTPSCVCFLTEKQFMAHNSGLLTRRCSLSGTRLQTRAILWVLMGSGLLSVVSHQIQMKLSLEQLEKLSGVWGGGVRSKVSAAGNQSLNDRAPNSHSLEPGQRAWAPYRELCEQVTPRLAGIGHRAGPREGAPYYSSGAVGW